MRRIHSLLAVTMCSALLVVSKVASADTLRVPQDFATIQAAVDAANPGDQIRVSAGDWCGATIAKTLDLFGEGATIIGCPAPALLRGLIRIRIGFALSDPAASGSTIRHFIFDGEGVSNDNLDPLGFAVFPLSQDVDNVIVEQNRIIGTVQGITNTGGSGWMVNHNVIEGLTLFDCVAGTDANICGGGVGIVFQERDIPATPVWQTDNTAMFNDLTGALPAGFDVFDMVGILALGGQDGTVVQKNRISLTGSDGTADTVAVEASDACCGSDDSFLNTKNLVIVNNDGRDSDLAVVITLDADMGNANCDGAFLRGNFGVNDICNSETIVTNRSIFTIEEF